MGPNSRALLQQAHQRRSLQRGLSLRYGQRDRDRLRTALRASRITYVGELGWEIYVPSEYAPGAFDLLLEEGKAFGLKPAGMHAMDLPAPGEGVPPLGPRHRRGRHAA